MFVTIFQKLVWLLLKPFFYLFFNYSIEGKENLKNLKGPMIIAANHKSNWDPFLLGTALPFKSPLWPLRFMAEKQEFNTFWLNFFYKIGLLKLFFYLGGGFPAIRRVNLKEALAEPIKILRNNGVIIIFPEGKRIFTKELGKGKRGTAALAIMAPAPILPVALKNWKVKIGQPFYLERISAINDEQFASETEQVMQKIKELYYN